MSNRNFRLDEIAEIVDCEHKTAPVVDSSIYRSIRTTDIKNGIIDYINANCVEYETYLEWTKREIPEAHDIILAREAPVGEVGWIREGNLVCLGQRTVLIKVINDDVSKRFLLYYLINPETKYELQVQSVGSVVSHLNMKDIRAFSISLPPLPEQKAIASVLSSLDDKIDLLHRQNKTLEAMAETLFRKWFIEEAQDDWEDGCLGDIADINPSYKIKKGAMAIYIEMKYLSTSTFNPESWCRREFTSGMKFKNGDTLLARITPCLENGKTAFITILDKEEIGCGSTEYIVIRMKTVYHAFVSYIIARDKEFRDFAISSMSGSSGRQRAEADMLKKFELKIPPKDIIANLNMQLNGIVEKLKNNAAQIRTLEKLRNNLLPKLMSDEVRVNYA